MAENTNLFSDFSGSYTPPENIKLEEDEQETNLFSDFSGVYTAPKSAIQEEPIEASPVVKAPEEESGGFFDSLTGAVEDFRKTSNLGGALLPRVMLGASSFLGQNPFEEKQNAIRREQKREAFKKEEEETYAQGKELEGMQELRRTGYMLEDAWRGIGGTASLALEEAGFLAPGTSAKALENYEAYGMDRRIEEMIAYSTEEGDKGKSKLGRAAKSTTAMLSYLWDNPMAGVNFLAMQAPAMLAAMPVARVATKGTGAFLKAISIARRLPKIATAIKLGTFGAAFNSTMGLFQSLGSNFEAGLQKFNGDEEKAKDYAFTKTTAELGPNAIAGAFLPLRVGVIAPSIARKSPIKTVIADVIGQGAIQATGGIQGAIAGAESVGEKVSRGELVAEGLFEFATAPIDLALSKGEINVAQAKQRLVDTFAEQFEEGVVTEAQVEQAAKIVDDGTASGKSLIEIGRDLDVFAVDLVSEPEVARRTSLNRQGDIDTEETSIPAGTPRITPKEQKINLFDAQGQAVEGVIERQNDSGVIQANVNGRSVIVDESEFSTVDPTSPNREFETLDENKNVSELSNEELASISDTVENQVKSLGEAGAVLPTYNPLVRDLTSIRSEQERRGIRPIAKSAKPRVKVRGVIQNPTPADVQKLTQGQQTEFNFNEPSILGPQKPKTTTEVVPEQSALDIETTSDVDTQIDNILNTIDKPASTVTNIDTELLDSMATELEYEDSMYDDLSREERIDLFARALQVTQTPEMEGTSALQTATTILERASPFQIKLAEEKLTTLGAAPNEQLSYKAEPVASQGHTKKLGFGKLTDIPDRENLKSETQFMRSLDELMNAYAMGLERPEDLVPRIDALLARAKRLRGTEKELRNKRQRQGGTRLIKTRLNEAVRRGELNPKTYDLFEWVINQNPDLAAQVGISVIQRTDKIASGTRGSYTPYSRRGRAFKSLEALAAALDDPNYNPLMGVIRIIKDGPNSTSETAVHELLHHMERMLPSDVQTSIREAWEKGLDTQINISSQLEKSLANILNLPNGLTNVELVAANPEVYKQLQEAKLRTIALMYLKQVNESKDFSRYQAMYGAFNNRDDGVFDNIKKELKLPLDTVPLQNEDYQYFNPSEFWAVNAARILEGRYDIKDSVLKKIKNWVSEFITKLKGLVGVDPNSPLLKALDDLIKGKISAEFKSEDMLLGNWNGNPGKAAMAQATEFRNIINNNKPQSKKGVGEARKLLTDVINGTKKGIEYTVTDPAGAIRFGWLGLLDTFSIFDGVRKSTNTVMKNYVNRLDEILGSLRKDQTRLMQLGTDKLAKFARFVAEAPIPGRILQDLMSVASAIRFDPSKYNSISDAIQKDRGLIILEDRLKNKTPTEEDINNGDYIFGEDWETRDIKAQMEERKDFIRSIMRDWLALGKMQRAPSNVQGVKPKIKVNKRKGLVDVNEQPKPYLGEAHDIYKEIGGVYKQILNEQEQIRLANIDKTDLPQETKDKIKLDTLKKYQTMRNNTPYFPLYRFGDFWFRVPKSSQNYGLWVYDTKEQRDAAIQKMGGELEKAGESREIITKGDTKESLQKTVTNDTILQDVISKLDAVSRAQENKIGELGMPSQEEIKRQIDSIKNDFIEMYLQTLPDKDLRARMLKRKAVAGYSTDQVRAFATYMSAVSAQLPRSKYKKDSELATQQARESLQEDPNNKALTQIINELAERMNFQFAPPKFSEAQKIAESLLSQLVFYKYLVGVDTFLQNYSVLTTFAPAILGTKYGYTSVGIALSKYITAAANPISKVNTQGVELGGMEPGVTDVEDFSLFNTPLVQNNPVLQAAYKYYNDQAGFNTNYISDLTHFAAQSSEVSLEDINNPSTSKKVLDAASLGFRITERQTREIVYLVAFDLAFKKKLKKVKAGDTKGAEQAFEEAVRDAKQDTQEVAFNYDPFNRNFNRLVNRTSFVGWAARQGSRLGSFRFQAMGLILRNMAHTLIVRDIPIKQRAQALQNLVGLFVFGTITGGIPAATGSWGLFVLLSYFAKEAIKESFDEDIPEEAALKATLDNKFTNGNLRLWFYRDWLPSKFGGEETFMTRLGRGGIFNAMTGYDFSRKLDFDFLAPSVYSRPSSSVDAAIGNAASTVLGVTASDAEGVYTTLKEVATLISNGQQGDALYELMRDAVTSQNQISDLYTGGSEKLFGVAGKRGLPVSKEEITALDTIMRMFIGVQTERRASTDKIVQMMSKEVQKVEAEITELRSRIREKSEELEYKKEGREADSARRSLNNAKEKLIALENKYEAFVAEDAIGERGDEASKEGREKVNKPLYESGLKKDDAESIDVQMRRRELKAERENYMREQQE